jgi:hypothetical protein
VRFTTVALNAPDHLCPTGADVYLQAEPTATGGATVRWRVEEHDPRTCGLLPDAVDGEAAVTGPCCDTVINRYLAASDTTFRIVVRTDWQP